jgi:hypothetical protein
MQSTKVIFELISNLIGLFCISCACIFSSSFKTMHFSHLFRWTALLFAFACTAAVCLDSSAPSPSLRTKQRTPCSLTHNDTIIYPNRESRAYSEASIPNRSYLHAQAPAQSSQTSSPMHNHSYALFITSFTINSPSHLIISDHHRHPLVRQPSQLRTGSGQQASSVFSALIPVMWIGHSHVCIWIGCISVVSCSDFAFSGFALWVEGQLLDCSYRDHHTHRLLLPLHLRRCCCASAPVDFVDYE